MKIKEMAKIIDGLVEEMQYEYDLIGIRFEDKDRLEGEEVTDCSRNNIDRDDERDFPEYGTAEYVEMEEMDGISTWGLTSSLNTWLFCNPEADARKEFMNNKHAYVIGGNKTGWEQFNGLVDDGELLIADPVVLKVLF